MVGGSGGPQPRGLDSSVALPGSRMGAWPWSGMDGVGQGTVHLGRLQQLLSVLVQCPAQWPSPDCCHDSMPWAAMIEPRSAIAPLVCCSPKGVSPAVAPSRGAQRRLLLLGKKPQVVRLGRARTNRQSESGFGACPRLEAVFRVVCQSQLFCFLLPGPSLPCMQAPLTALPACSTGQSAVPLCCAGAVKGSPTSAIPSRDADPAF